MGSEYLSAQSVLAASLEPVVASQSYSLYMHYTCCNLEEHSSFQTVKSMSRGHHHGVTVLTHSDDCWSSEVPESFGLAGST
jgi:hypothetical protein